MKAIPRPEYPRPQFERATWLCLNGEWSYEFDFGKSGRERHVEKSKGFADKIIVPFCPESRLSGVAHTDFIEAMYYHRKVAIPAAWKGMRIILHFGAVDYESELYIDGVSYGVHFGGSCSFEFDVTEGLKDGKKHDLVLRVADDTRSGEQASGKQCPVYQSCGCSYTRVTGIWQSVWLEGVPQSGLKSCRIVPDLDNKAFLFTPVYYATEPGDLLRITVCANNKTVGTAETIAANGVGAAVKVKTLKLWEPGSPFLYDVKFEIVSAGGKILDTVKSYAGMRKVSVQDGMVYLNNRKIYQRLVLDQGFYPEGIWTAPSDADLKRDIELSMAAGFNGARLHQKVFEERFHYWADKLGYLTWGESASWGTLCFHQGSWKNNAESATFWRSAYQFKDEWLEVVRRDANHPSIITWTPTNETQSFKVKAYTKLITDLYDATKREDPTRPINDCSGWTHVKTDLWTVHLYKPNAAEYKRFLIPTDADLRPEKRPVWMTEPDFEGKAYHKQPYFCDEFGGFMYIPADRQKFAENTWGYHGIAIKNEDELCAKIAEQVKVMAEMDNLCGYCYTQLTDVEQEQNGVYNYDRTLKVSEGKLAKAFNQVPKWAKK